MVLHPSAPDEAPGRNSMQRSKIGRRRSKGTIAGFAFAKSDVAASPEMSGGEIPDSGSQGTAAGPNSPNPPQHSGEKNAGPAKPCNSARLALLCIQNTLRMGARTQLYLCPPGRSWPRSDASGSKRSQGCAGMRLPGHSYGSRILLKVGKLSGLLNLAYR